MSSELLAGKERKQALKITKEKQNCFEVDLQKSKRAGYQDVTCG